MHTMNTCTHVVVHCTGTGAGRANETCRHSPCLTHGGAERNTGELQPVLRIRLEFAALDSITNTRHASSIFSMLR